MVVNKLWNHKVQFKYTTELYDIKFRLEEENSCILARRSDKINQRYKGDLYNFASLENVILHYYQKERKEKKQLLNAQ